MQYVEVIQRKWYGHVEECLTDYLTGTLTSWTSWSAMEILDQGSHWPGKSELIWSGKSGNFIGGQGKMMCIVRIAWLLFILWKNEDTHSVHVLRKRWRKGVSVGEGKLTRNCIKLVLAPQMGQGIMLNTVREFHFWSWVSGWTVLKSRCRTDELTEVQHVNGHLNRQQRHNFADRPSSYLQYATGRQYNYVVSRGAIVEVDQWCWWCRGENAIE